MTKEVPNESARPTPTAATSDPAVIAELRAIRENQNRLFLAQHLPGAILFVAIVIFFWRYVF